MDWNRPAVELERDVRAFSPWPGTFSWYGDKKLNILESSLYDGTIEKAEPGSVVALDKKQGLVIAAGEGALAVKRLQLQSKKPMDYKSFVNGNREFVGSKLEKRSGDS